MNRAFKTLVIVLITVAFFAFVPQDTTLKVARISIAAAIENLEPVDVSTTFSKDTETVYCFTQITGAEDETFVIHRWKFDSHQWDVKLNVKGSSWRTYSSKKLVSDWVGTWQVQILDANEEVIGETTFEVTE